MRNLIAIVEEAQGWLFHATLADNLPSIREYGLTPNSDRAPNFDGYPVEGRLFVATSQAAAAFYMDALEERGEMVLLRFPAKGVNLASDPYGNPSDRYTKATIPPSRIDVLQDGGWANLTQVKPSQPAATIPPVFGVEGFSVFVAPYGFEITDDGKPVDKNGENLVCRLVVNGSTILDAALPKPQHLEAIKRLIAQRGWTIEGRAARILSSTPP